MKKALSLALAVMLALAAFSFASAEEGKAAGLFWLYENDGGTLTRIAFAVPILDGVLVAPAGLLPQEADRLSLSDGEALWDVKALIVDESGSLAMLFYDPEKQPPRLGAWPLMALWKNADPASCVVRSADAEGSETVRGVLGAEKIRWKDHSRFLVTLEGPVPAGSPVLTAGGELAGVLVAEWAEGVNRYLMMPADEIAAGLNGAVGLLDNLPGWSETPEGLKVTLDRNCAIVDWTDLALPEKAEGEQVYIVVLDTGNTYLNFFPAETENRVASLLLTPGRIYLIGAAASAGMPDSAPEAFATVSVPQAEKLTEYSFRPVLTALAVAPEEGLKDGESPVPVTEVTEELLRSGRVYFYSHSAYEVTEDIEGKTLLVTLTDPNGVNYRYESAWTYSPDFMAADIWYLPLGDMGLTSTLDRKGYPAGVYRVAYYVDGELADSFDFELK